MVPFYHSNIIAWSRGFSHWLSDQYATTTKRATCDTHGDIVQSFYIAPLYRFKCRSGFKLWNTFEIKLKNLKYLPTRATRFDLCMWYHLLIGSFHCRIILGGYMSFISLGLTLSLSPPDFTSYRFVNCFSTCAPGCPERESLLNRDKCCRWHVSSTHSNIYPNMQSTRRTYYGVVSL